MTTPEYFPRSEKSDSDEDGDLKRLEAAADAARIAGVYDPSETEGEN